MCVCVCVCVCVWRGKFMQGGIMNNGSEWRGRRNNTVVGCERRKAGVIEGKVMQGIVFHFTVSRTDV